MYDLIILGGGPGGTRAAELASKAGLKTVLVEMDRLGGTCLNRGCIPTKAYYSALVGGRVSPEDMWNYREGIVKKLGEGISTLMKMSGAEILRGRGKIVSAGEPKILEVETADGIKRVEGRLLLLAPGARSLPLEFEGAHLPGVLTGDWAVTESDLWKYPETEGVKSVGIVGAGVIAVEFAVLLRRMGKEVTILKHSDQLLRRADRDIKKKLAQSFKKMKITLVDYLSPERAVAEEGKIRLEGKTREGEYSLLCDRLLLASSMVPILDGYGLENTTIKHSEKGISVDSHMETNLPGVYALGDVTGGMMLAHLAEYQALSAVEHMLEKEYTIEKDHVSWCVFSDPEIAAVGLSEDEAERRGVAVKTARAYFLGNGMALAMNSTDGFIKVVASKEDDTLLGVHIIGPEAASLIGEAALAVGYRMKAADVARTVHPHPTLTECFKEALFRLEE